MTKYKSSGVKQSVYNAIHGLKLAFCSQRNFVIEVCISFFVFVLASFLNFSVTDLCLLIVMTAIVLICELFNSVIEFTLDAVYKNQYSNLVKMAKDISAGIVVLASFFSVMFGILLFGKYILNYSNV